MFILLFVLGNYNDSDRNDFAYYYAYKVRLIN